MPKILLFIPMYNCEKQIVRVLAQLTNEICTYLSEIILIDNCSIDNSESVVQNYLASVKLPVNVLLLRNKANYGLGGSHKVAFQYAIRNGFDYIITLHGDDQGQIADFLPLLKNRTYQKYDCCLGSRFMKDSTLRGYSKLRIVGNYIFNLLFSIVLRRRISDLGSGLNMYRVASLITEYFMKYPDTLYFNGVMLLASSYYRQNILFYPISWREDDQRSNANLWRLSYALFKMLLQYIRNRKEYLLQDMRLQKVEAYGTQVIYRSTLH